MLAGGGVLCGTATEYTLVGARGSFGHECHGEFPGARRPGLPESLSKLSIPHERCRGAGKGLCVAWRHEEPAGAVDDQLWKAADSKGYWWNAQRHGVDDGGAQSFRRRRMP